MDDSEGLETTPNVAYPLTEHVLPDFYTGHVEEILRRVCACKRRREGRKRPPKRITPVRML